MGSRELSRSCFGAQEYVGVRVWEDGGIALSAVV
jgi:hypothetical protein